MSKGVQRDKRRNREPDEVETQPEAVMALDVMDTMGSCCDCGHTFVIKLTEKERFLARGWSLRKRGWDCVQKKHDLDAAPRPKVVNR